MRLRLGLLGAAALVLASAAALASEYESLMTPNWRGGPIMPGAGGPMNPAKHGGGSGGGGAGGTNLLDFSVAANSQYFGVFGP